MAELEIGARIYTVDTLGAAVPAEVLLIPSGLTLPLPPSTFLAPAFFHIPPFVPHLVYAKAPGYKPATVPIMNTRLSQSHTITLERK